MRKAISRAGYEDDLAYIHDVGFSFFAVQAGPGILQILRDMGVASGLVVDLGCGSGLFTRQLYETGYEVLGIDFSAAMLKIARRRVTGAKFQRASFREAALPACDAVTALGEVFNFLFDRANTEETLIEFFRRVYDALRPGGVFIFDVAEPGRAGGPGKRQRNFAADDWALMLETEEDENEAILTRRMTTFRRLGKLYRRTEEVHRLRLYRGRDIAAGLRRLGFRARLEHTYGEFRFPKGWVGVVARKPGATP
jgi:SAM-dependent methyltransferase